MAKAIETIRNGTMGLKKTCKEFNVPRTTLQRRARMLGDSSISAKKGLGSRKPVFSEAMENELVRHVKDMESMLFGFSPSQLRKVAYQYAEANEIDHPFSQEEKAAGIDWLKGFMSRHQKSLSLRTPEPTSAARARGFNQVSVNTFFNLLEKLQEKYKFTPDRIFNVDETGITTVPNKPMRIIGTRGKKQVGTLSSAERGQLVTVEICMSASGYYIPPMFIYPRVRMKPELMDQAPPGAIAEAHKSGWMQSDIFVKWFKHFCQCCNPTADKPVLLILDGHKTHTQNLEFINMARERSVVVLCLPPHCSHRLQPLDVAFMKPLMTYYAQEVQNWLRAHPGRVVTTYQIAELFRGAYLSAVTLRTATKGFEKAGIWPVNRNIFQKEDFAAAAPTDIPDEAHHINAPDVPQPVTGPVVPQPVTGPVVPQPADGPVDVPTINIRVVSPLPKVTSSVRRKTLRSGKTCIITSSPYKRNLELEKTKGPSSKEVKKKRTKESEPPSKKSKKIRATTEEHGPTPSTSGTAPTSAQRKSSNTNAECLYCNEKFSDSLPGEIWIQCSQCKEWAHQDCSGHEVGDFECEMCA